MVVLMAPCNSMKGDVLEDYLFKQSVKMRDGRAGRTKGLKLCCISLEMKQDSMRCSTRGHNL